LTAAGVGRYYDPGTGQFLGVDPIVEQTQETYEYAEGDPANASDPTGLGKPQPPTLSPREEEAIAKQKAGEPYDHTLYNSAKKKLRQGGKYRGEINVQKRQSNYSVTIPTFRAVFLTPAEYKSFATLTLVGAAAAGAAGIVIVLIILLGFL